MSYNSSAVINITNNTGGNAIITLAHRYCDDIPQVNSVKMGLEATAEILTANFNSGFLISGMNCWWIGIQVLNGPNAGHYTIEGSSENPVVENLLESDDKRTSINFTVNTEAFTMNSFAGSVSTEVISVSDAISMDNFFAAA